MRARTVKLSLLGALLVTSLQATPAHAYPYPWDCTPYGGWAPLPVTVGSWGSVHFCRYNEGWLEEDVQLAQNLAESWTATVEDLANPEPSPEPTTTPTPTPEPTHPGKGPKNK